MSQNKIYVGNIPLSFSEDDLKSTFADYGDIDSINMISDRDTGNPRGFAFITFVKQHGAETALQMNGAEIMGRKLNVSMAKEKQPRRQKRGFRR